MNGIFRNQTKTQPPELKSIIRLERLGASGFILSNGANELTISATPRSLALTTARRLSGSPSHSEALVDSIRQAFLMSTWTRPEVSVPRAPTASSNRGTNAESPTIGSDPLTAPPRGLHDLGLCICNSIRRGGGEHHVVTGLRERHRQVTSDPPTAPGDDGQRLESNRIRNVSGAIVSTVRAVGEPLAHGLNSSASYLCAAALRSQLRRSLTHRQCVIGLERTIRSAAGQ